ncbi:MAG: hypothetical protein EBZ83_04375 [Verrucomicrobia bacterium]|nr:hypothetical protein [Verrucomicrobiota bacterium]
MSAGTDPAKVRKKKGKCRNFEGGECVKAELGEIQEIPENDLFICEDCKQPLTELPGAGNKALIPLLIGGVGVVFFGGIALLLAACPGKPAEVSWPTIYGQVGKEIVPVDLGSDPLFASKNVQDLLEEGLLPAGVSLGGDHFLKGAPQLPGTSANKVYGKNAKGKIVLVYNLKFDVTRAEEPVAPPAPPAEVVPQPPEKPPVKLTGVQKANLVGSIFFEQGSSDLNEEALEKIEETARLIKENHADVSQIILMGFASREGEEESNRELASRRGKAVQRQLEPQLSGKTIVILEGTIPADGTSVRDLPRDRRVDIQVSK